ncbi:MAG: hypothetical protein K2W95_12880 [Candidatus Obscuribacterales bacterium]|nr:hypothetical protein [Candidatus Obscuribacterales bacterium]
MQELENIGSIKRTTLNDGWIEHPRQPDEFSDSWSRTFTLAFDPSVELIFFCRGTSVDVESAAYYRQLGSEKPALSGDEKLTPQEIIRLQMVLGYSNAGNNQYTNPKQAGEPGGPAFDLKEAFCRRVDSRMVLFVRGKFVQGKYYAGILFLAEETFGRVVEEIVLQATSNRKLQDNLYHLDHAANSIKWVNSAVVQ